MKIRLNKLMLAAKVLLVITTVITTGVSLDHLTYAATGSLTFSPASGSYTVGNTFTVDVQENSGTDAVNTVDAYVTFPSNLLQFVSDTTVAPFNTNPVGSDTANGGNLTITRSQLGTSSKSGQTVTTITFKVLAAGTATVGFNSGSSDILTAVVPATNVLTSSPSASFTLSNPVTGGGGGGSSGGGGGTTSGGGSTSSGSGAAPAAKAPSTASKSTSVSVTPSTSKSTPTGAGSVTVPDNGNVAVSKPVSVQPATVQTDGVKKVDYYLNNKLVDTETSSPYKYNIDTTKLKNGTYKLVSKTYYTNGTTKQATQHLVVNNVATHTSTWIYLLIVSVIILLIVGVNLFGPTDGPFRHLFRHNPQLPLSHVGGGFSGITLGGPTPTVSDLTLHQEPEVPINTITPSAPTSVAPSPPTTIAVQHESDTPDGSESVEDRLSHISGGPVSAPGEVIQPDKDK